MLQTAAGARSARALLQALVAHVEGGGAQSGGSAVPGRGQTVPGLCLSWGERVAVVKTLAAVRWVVLAVSSGLDGVDEVVWLQRRALALSLGLLPIVSSSFPPPRAPASHMEAKSLPSFWSPTLLAAVGEAPRLSAAYPPSTRSIGSCACLGSCPLVLSCIVLSCILYLCARHCVRQKRG